MRIVFLPVGTPDTPSSNYKVYQVKDKLEKLDIPCEIRAPGATLAAKLAPFLGPRDQVIYIQRLQYQTLFVLAAFVLKKITGAKTVYCLDDPVYEGARTRTHLLIKSSDLVLAGSHAIYDYCRKLNQHTVMSLSCVDTSLFRPLPRKREKNGVVLGWGGNPAGHAENVRLLLKPLKRLAGEIPGLELVSHPLGPEFTKIPGLRTRFVPYMNAARVPEFISEFDIGLVPLTDTPWSRGKYSIKVLEYMACGVPVVASAVGENNHFILDGENGFLANTADEWVEKIGALCGDRRLREKFAARGRKLVEEKYSQEAYAKNLACLLQERFRL